MFPESTAVFSPCTFECAWYELSEPSRKPAATSAPKQIIEIITPCANPIPTHDHPAATSTIVRE